jgi:hypothetical protein
MGNKYRVATSLNLNRVFLKIVRLSKYYYGIFSCPYASIKNRVVESVRGNLKKKLFYTSMKLHHFINKP